MLSIRTIFPIAVNKLGKHAIIQVIKNNRGFLTSDYLTVLKFVIFLIRSHAGTLGYLVDEKDGAMRDGSKPITLYLSL